MGKFLNIVVLAVVMRRCGNCKISNYRQNFLATLLHNGLQLTEGGVLLQNLFRETDFQMYDKVLYKD
ncbi:hypothetical protein KA001_03350 [Patescibacteria group bacterium]|nr:hypothetical protein [Patescibacteria group bacterium]